MTERNRVQIDLRLQPGERTSAILIGAGLLDDCGHLIAGAIEARHAALVADAAVASTHACIVEASLQRAGVRTHTMAIESSEDRKTLDTAAHLYSTFLEAGLDRTGCVVAIGGGIVTDVAGFAAATFMRGVPLINIPTTLLGMVDAAIGGKTGVNFPLPGSPTLGKNLVGAFHHPCVVLMDVETLATLPPRAFRCGLAECIKHAVIADPTLLDWMEHHAAALTPARSSELVDFIARNVRIKADIVTSDERESSDRMALNLGHTFAHAIETRPELRLEHGEAVALGLLAACAAGESLGSTSPDLRPRLARLIARLELPTKLPTAPPAAEVVHAMRSDKKARGGAIRLIIPDSPGRIQIIDSAPESAIAAGLTVIAP